MKLLGNVTQLVFLDFHQASRENPQLGLSDLYLLEKLGVLHSNRRLGGQRFGQAHVFYPEATEERCTAALLLDIDPIQLFRSRRASGNSSGNAALTAWTVTVFEYPLTSLPDAVAVALTS